MRALVAIVLTFCVYVILNSCASDNPTDSTRPRTDTTINHDSTDTLTDTSSDTSAIDTGIDNGDTSQTDTSQTDTSHVDSLSSRLSGIILSTADTLHLTPIPFANILIYDATTNQPVTRTTADSLGRYSIDVPPGVYYLKIDALGFYSSPSDFGAPVPFEVAQDGSNYHQFELKPDTSASHYAIIRGSVLDSTTGVSGVLVIAVRTTDTLSISAATGADGGYLLCNVPAGTFTIRSYLAGYKALDTITRTVTNDAEINGADLHITPFTGTHLTGHITFRSITNGIVDITLIDPVTREAIPGLQTLDSLTGQTYSMNNIPPGTYITWASYKNDGYIVDPDYVFKFGLPQMTYTATDTSFSADFSLTDAITIVSPTNKPESIYPVAISDSTPTFVWEKYPSTKEFIVVVYNSRGERVWGGFTNTGTVLHPQIDGQTTSCKFNFDGSAVSKLRTGEIYQWKVYADSDNEANVQKLISSSEDLMGLFYLPGAE